MNATQLCDKYVTAVSLARAYAPFFDEWDYPSRKLDGQGWDDVTHLNLSFRHWGGAHIDVNCHGPYARMLMRRVCKEMGGKWDKETTDYEFQLTQEIQGVEVTICASRDAVCTPRKVGTRSRTIPATEERVVTEDIVEWDCPPSLLEFTNE